LKYIPNLFSLARLALAPYVFVLLSRRDYRLALVLFGIAGLTDWLDGVFARRFGTTSRLGAVLDPVADKVLLSGSFLVLALTGAIETWVAALVIGRDLLILLFAAGAFLVSKTRRDFPPSAWGKASTVVQIAFVLAVVGQLTSMIVPLQWLTVALTAWSGVDYAWRLWTP
jgi:cardiolipin synthase (CMP-forming)